MDNKREREVGHGKIVTDVICKCGLYTNFRVNEKLQKKSLRFPKKKYI
jgi:hypothetical protein